MVEPTQEELKLLKLFKKKVDDLELTSGQSTNHDLLRWIRARNNNLEKAEEMLRKSIAWRRENDIDNILTWTAPADITSRCHVKMEGSDEDNSPILTSFLGRVDMKRIYQLGLRGEYLKFSSQLFERILEKCRNRTTRDGHPVTQFILIVDMEGFSSSTLMSKGAINMSLDYLKIFEANYPETLKKFVLVNANNVTMMMYNLAKHLMSAETMRKFQILGTEPSKWKPVLLEIVPADQLCPRFGGTKKCESSCCCPDVGNKDLYQSVTIGAGKQFVQQIEAQEIGNKIKWAFSTSAYDIQFSVLYNDDIVVPQKKIEASGGMEEGTLECEHTGVYTLLFNNSHSRFRSKQLSYQVQLLNCASDWVNLCWYEGRDQETKKNGSICQTLTPALTDVTSIGHNHPEDITVWSIAAKFEVNPWGRNEISHGFT
ncbi:unnamed protein product [Allacma fusca]|uniref:CRAL-TRIO domain-containing protein n=1 Tax=Allacma fusca TaxID=39272 RepID=A0A8J2K3L7_9HEXA|nr:unnamed protein product [Allacma fusca]